MAPRIWIMTNSLLNGVLADGTGLAQAVVDVTGNTVYEINKLTDTPHTLTNALLRSLLVVNDYETELTTGTGVYYGLLTELQIGIPSYYSAIMYDNEAWTLDVTNGYVPQTRTIQQANAINWYKRAGDLIRCYGYTAVCAPARDLSSVLWPVASADAQTLSSGIQGAAAPFYDVVHVQAQNDQPTAAAGYTLPATAFNSFVGSSISQIRAASPSAVITCGLAVHAADVAPYTNMQAMQQATATYSISQGCVGWWMNANGNTTGAIAAIQALSGI